MPYERSPDPASAETAHCPRGHRCESCGAEDPRLTVQLAATALGTFCWTACQRCAASGLPPRVALSTAGRLVEQHAGHHGGAR